MRPVLFGFVLMCLSATSVAAFRLEGIIDSVGPPLHLSRWIGLEWAGATTEPVPSMWYGVEDGTPRVHQSDGYVVLDRTEYEHLSAFIHSYGCSNDPIGSRPPYPNTIEVEELAHGREQVLCYLPHERSCDFLSHVSALRGAAPTKEEKWILSILWTGTRCDKGANPFSK